MADQNRSSSIGTILGRMGEGFVDSLADNGLRVGKVLGGTLQAAFNTEGYQQNKAMRDLVLRSREADAIGKEVQNMELFQDIPVNMSNRALQFHRNQEYLDNAPLRDQQRKLASSELYMAQQRAYQGIYDAESAIASRNEIDRLKAENPFARDISDEGLQRFTSSAQFQEATTFNTLGRLYFQSKQSDDPVQKGAFERALRDNGMEIIDRDGKEYLYNSSTDRLVELNEENFNKARTMLAENINKELGVSFALEGRRDNLQKNAINKSLSPEILGVYSNSKSDAVMDYMNFMKSLPDAEYHDFLLLGGLQDAFLDGVISADEQQALFPQLLDIANKVGYRVHVDNANPTNTQIEKADGSRVSLQQFAKDLEASNTVGEKYNRYVMAKFGGNRRASDANNMSEINDITQNMSEFQQESFNRGNQFVNDYGLSDAIDQIWRERGDNKKITSREDILIAFGLAADDAEQFFLESPHDAEGYKKAQDIFERTLEKYGIPKSLVPDIWTDIYLDKELERLQSEQKEIVQERKDLRDDEGIEIIDGSQGKAHLIRFDRYGVMDNKTAYTLRSKEGKEKLASAYKAAEKYDKNAERIKEISDQQIQRKENKRAQSERAVKNILRLQEFRESR